MGMAMTTRFLATITVANEHKFDEEFVRDGFNVYYAGEVDPYLHAKLKETGCWLYEVNIDDNPHQAAFETEQYVTQYMIYRLELYMNRGLG